MSLFILIPTFKHWDTRIFDWCLPDATLLYTLVLPVLNGVWIPGVQRKIMQFSNVVQIPIPNENKEEMDNYIIFSHPYGKGFSMVTWRLWFIILVLRWLLYYSLPFGCHHSMFRITITSFRMPFESDSQNLNIDTIILGLENQSHAF